MDSAGREADQSSSGFDQTSADGDQTTSDADQSLADRDQTASEADQRISDRDQAASDRELGEHPSPNPNRLRSHEEARAERNRGTVARIATTEIRGQIAAERHELARHRDEVAHSRDEAATSRDRRNEEVDEAAEELAGRLGKDSPAAKVAAVARAAAAAARAHAAQDRDRAAGDREAAAQDREVLKGEIERSHMDEPTGAYGRQMGEVLLRHQVDRARRIRGSLALGVISIEVAKGEATSGGSPGRAALLGDACHALQTRLRPHDPVVRWSESEFVCAIADATAEQAHYQLNGARYDISRDHPSAQVKGGSAALVDSDGLESLIARARVDLNR
jgi:GGDEF domain-containing protein